MYDFMHDIIIDEWLCKDYEEFDGEVEVCSVRTYYFLASIFGN